MWSRRILRMGLASSVATTVPAALALLGCLLVSNGPATARGRYFVAIRQYVSNRSKTSSQRYVRKWPKADLGELLMNVRLQGVKRT